MQIIVNGVSQTLDQSLTLAKALALWGYSNNMPFAVAVDNQVIAQQNYEGTILAEGNSIEILMPMQGG